MLVNSYLVIVLYCEREGPFRRRKINGLKLCRLKLMSKTLKLKYNKYINKLYNHAVRYYFILTSNFTYSDIRLNLKTIGIFYQHMARNNTLL